MHLDFLGLKTGRTRCGLQFSGSHSDSDSLRKNGKSISSDGMDDSGMGSASDSGQKTGNSDSEPETISEKTAQAAAELIDELYRSLE